MFLINVLYETTREPDEFSLLERMVMILILYL